LPTLYIVPTPIGNLEDITLRALRVLGEVDVIAAEDTRVSRKLLARYEITTRVTSFHEHNRRSKLGELLELLVDSDVALVSDAGMPTINDPGQDLVAAAVESGFEVAPLPGASAVTTALAASGIEVDGFVYVGFLPRERTKRVGLLSSLSRETRPIVAFETPHRLASALADIMETLGDRKIAVCRELTKLHEEVYRGTVSGAISHFVKPRGEFTLVVEGTAETSASEDEMDAVELLVEAKTRGLTARDAIAEVGSVTGVSRRELYSRWLEIGS
jgi:16S rRNA (cytidine1402-2'-O)-methyltransferase